PLVLLVQLLLLLLCTGLAVRTAIGPLTRLVKAVEHLDPNRPAQPLAETGPREVAHAAAAFNAMQARIADAQLVEFAAAQLSNVEAGDAFSRRLVDFLLSA
ncbi:HAMP domain-containing protein, partial [Acinetobacter baumannii]